MLPRRQAVLLLLLLSFVDRFSHAFLVVQQRPSTSEYCGRCLAKKDGYQFGDISRGVLGKFQQNVNSLTGKGRYEFGDLSKWLDQKAKQGVNALDLAAKGQVNDFTNKPNYEFGDFTKEIVRRLQAGEYTAEDVWLLLKMVALVGVNFQPVASILPAKVLMDMLEVSIAQSMGEKVVGTLSTEVDQRMKHWITGDKDYQLGDVTKQTLMGDKDYRFGDISKQVLMGDKNYEFGDLTKKAISSFTGKDSYSIGDVTNTLLERTDDSNKSDKGERTGSSTNFLNMDKQAKQDFEAWDKDYLATQTDKTKVEEHEFKNWDKQFIEVSTKDEKNSDQ